VNELTAVFITHDVDKTDYFDFILVNIQNLSQNKGLPSPLFCEYFIYLHASNNDTPSEKIESVFEELGLAVEKYCGLPKERLRRVKNLKEKEDIYTSRNFAQVKILQFESDMLLPRVFCYTQIWDVIQHPPANFYFPIIRYKYNYKLIKYGSAPEKVRTVRNFIKSPARWFQSRTPEPFEPDWDERLYVNQEIMEKMGGALPVAQPCPYIHDWGDHVHTIFNNKAEEQIYESNSRYAIHQFEYLGEGE